MTDHTVHPNTASLDTFIIPDLGQCCACEKEDVHSVRNIVCLDRLAPVPGTGWGCFVCGLPMNGASAVICDECLRDEKEIRFAIKGLAADKQRIPLDELSPYAFQHDPAKHSEDKDYDDWYEHAGEFDDDNEEEYL
jgi:hypothetical protein